MLDVGWSELLLIGVVALIVVGPEDLPRMFHTLGRMTAKAKAMAREFSGAMEDAARESGIKDAASSLDEVRSLTSRKSLGLDALDRAATKFEQWDPKLPKKGSPVAPDPAQPAVEVDAAGAPATAADTAIAEAPPPAAEVSQATPPAEAAPGRRSLKAVRRADSRDA